MKIHAFCIAKNEADILRETLISALHWCDHIYVLDNGSDDGSWELVNDLAKQHSQIVPYKQDNTPFTNGLRADIFNEFRSNAAAGDWWCQLDADEIYIDDPSIFLSKIEDRYQTVWTASFNYFFTDEDAVLYRKDPAKYLEIPVQQRLRYYLNHHGELRFFRHNDDIVWARTQHYGTVPEALFYLASAYPVRIWLKHYQYRSPEQIERRLLTRRSAIEANLFQHETTGNWRAAVAHTRTAEYKGPMRYFNTSLYDPRPEFPGARWEERVVPAASLDYDAFDRRYIVNERLMPKFPLRRSARSRLKAAVPAPIRAPVGRVLRQTLGVLGWLRPI
jgi:glycosyltransferase involved in cell wall biosynthesis